MADREVYWHLPGFYTCRLLNQVILNMMKDYPEAFREGYRIGSVYGTFPGAIWNGGRTIMGIIDQAEMKSVLEQYNSRGVPVRFTWTNSVLEEKHVYDTYCNLIMRLADNGLNQALVNSSVLEDYIRREYPGYKLISSTTKRLTKPNELQTEMEKDYYLVVLDYDLNHNANVLRSLEPHAGKVEILVNEICVPDCKLRTQHYLHQSRRQLDYDMSHPFVCPNRTGEAGFQDCMKRPAFFSNEQIEEYIDRGFVNYKIVGRGMPMEFVKDSYLYFLVKEEQRDFIREKIDNLFARFRQMSVGKR